MSVLWTIVRGQVDVERGHHWLEGRKTKMSEWEKGRDGGGKTCCGMVIHCSEFAELDRQRDTHAHTHDVVI